MALLCCGNELSSPLTSTMCARQDSGQASGRNRSRRLLASSEMKSVSSIFMRGCDGIAE